MKRLTLLLLLLSTGEIFAQTAREYYKEVHDSNGLNPLLTFVCFPEEDTGLFWALGLTRTFPNTAERKQLKQFSEKDKQVFLKADQLYVQGFYKTIPRDPILFDREEKSSDVGWVTTYKGMEGHPNARIRLSFHINWQTLRYESQITIDTANSVQYGKCETIK